MSAAATTSESVRKTKKNKNIYKHVMKKADNPVHEDDVHFGPHVSFRHTAIARRYMNKFT